MKLVEWRNNYTQDNLHVDNAWSKRGNVSIVACAHNIYKVVLCTKSFLCPHSFKTKAQHAISLGWINKSSRIKSCCFYLFVSPLFTFYFLIWLPFYTLQLFSTEMLGKHSALIPQSIEFWHRGTCNHSRVFQENLCSILIPEALYPT